MGLRIPHGNSGVELRQAFQRVEALVGILSEGTSGELLVGVAANLNPIWQSVGEAIDHGAVGGLTDDDHTHYSLADGTRDFTGVVVGVAPTNSNHLATKEYVDQSVHFIAEYFLSDTASDIGGIYYDMIDQDPSNGQVDLDSAGLSGGDDQALVNWATVAGVPGVTNMEHGVYGVHLHAERVSGVRSVNLYFELYRREADTTETLLATSEVSSAITSAGAVDLHATLSSDTTILVADRVVIKFFANIGSSGNATVVRLSIEGDTSAHFTIPTSTEVLSTVFLRQDGTKDLTGNMSVDAGITIDGRDLSVDGTKLDGIESGADVTDATNVAAAGAAMSGGAFHDGFSDFVGNEHIDHSGVDITAGSGIAGGGDLTTTRTVDLDINSLAAATIVTGDFVPFWDITATATNKKTTFANFEAALTHDNLISGTIADHDTTATGANLTSLTDDSMADTLHRHSELSASDGTPDQAVTVDATGQVGIGVTPSRFFHVKDGASGTTGITNTRAFFESSGVNYLGIATPDATEGGIVFSSPSSAVRGGFFIRANNDFHIRAGGNNTVIMVGGDRKVGVSRAVVPDAPLEVETSTTEGTQAVTIDQNDADQAFIDFQGTSAASAANSISTWTTGNSIQGFTRQEINGTTYWMPYYDAPTS